jgi:hypothetical protein
MPTRKPKVYYLERVAIKQDKYSRGIADKLGLD